MLKSYRPEIDGLRAVAILAVIFYHYSPRYMPGGYAGVDIFLVIAGYLSALAVFRGLEKQSFRLHQFYLRRILRLLPALLALLAAAYVVSYLFLFSVEYASFNKSVLFSLLFSQNFNLYLERGSYFQTDSILAPLLHLWYLGLVAQFYLVFPLITWVIAKLRMGFGMGFSIIALLSLATNVYLAHYNPAGSYYFPQARFWELFAGAALAAYQYHGQKIPRKGYDHRGRDPRPLARMQYAITRHPNISFWLGALSIGISFFVFNESRLLWGFWAVPTAVGTLLLLSVGGQLKLLSHPLLVLIGKVSYPLYLWHWTLLSLIRIITAGYVSLALRLALVLCSFALALLSHYLLEKNMLAAGRKRKLLLLAAYLLLLSLSLYNLQPKDSHSPGNYLLSLIAPHAGAALNLQKTRDYPPGLPCRVNSADGARAEPRFCQLGPPGERRVLLVGDSHMESLYYLFGKLAEDLGFRGYFTILGNGNALGESLPWQQNVLRHYPQTPLESAYAPYYDKVYREAVRLGVSEVIIAGRWAAYFVEEQDMPQKKAAKDLQDILANTAVLRQNGMHITILQDAPVQKSLENFADVIRQIAAGRLSPAAVPTISRAAYQKQNHYVNQLFAEVAQKYPDDFSVIETADIYCPDGKTCPAFDLEHLRSYYYEATHQSSIAGAMRLYPLLKDYLR